MIDNTDTCRPVKRARMHEQVIRVLLKKIFRGEIAVGDKLPTERALARKFQVNRATVREALRYIENLGLIAIRQGDGAYVRDYLESGNLEIAKAMVQVDDAMRLEILSALMEIRRINLPEVAHAAALKRSATHLRRLEKAAHHSPDLPVMERDKQIHHIIGHFAIILS
ncbi:MAG: FadR family transcriptional regulator [Desulfosarcina sp.]|nr:FadR family transcriptional regulator [Desulfobacterales bacterium]